MTADQDVNNALNGVDGSGAPLPWRPVHVRGRQILSGLAKLLPFAWPNTHSTSTVSALDYVEGTAEQVASRHIDPYGNVVDFFTTWVVDWYWKLDGCPTPLPQARLAQYLALANRLNPWPTGYPGINPTQFPGEQYATYPAWPPVTPVPLDHFLP